MPRQMTMTDFEDRGTLIKYLAEQLTGGRLALVLGAGVSSYFGLPKWDDLLERLYARRGITRDPNLDLKRQAQFFKNEFFKNDKKGFIATVREELYHGISIDFESMRRYPTLGAIGSLVMSSKRGSASDVITFNWDDLLEIYLGYHGFVTSSIIQDRFWAENSDVRVLHPHGFLPYDPATLGTDDIIFDQTSYTSVIGDETQPWRQHMLTILMTHTCLFIGLSGTDDNLDNLLYRAQKSHAYSTDNTACWGLTFKTAGEQHLCSFWEERGIFCQEISDYNSDLPDFLFKICQEAGKQRSK